MKAAAIKRRLEKRIKESIENIDDYTERFITFLNNQSDDFCQENKKNNGLKMILLAENNFLVSQGWDDFEEYKKSYKQS